MNCIIVDDEPYAHQVLEHYINETPGLTLKASFRNAVEAFEYLGSHQVDLLFLDIEMPLVNGLHFLKALTDPPKTIFTTAYKQYAFEGFELDVTDYLLKPFSFERFSKAVKKAEIPAAAAADYTADTLLIKDKEGMLNLKQHDILYIEGCKDYVKINTKAGSHLIYHTLKGILDRLDAQVFLRSHRSYIVNRLHIERIHQDMLIMTDQSMVPIGQLFRKALLEKV
jgi:two-component system response regulator LytT